MRLAYYNIAEMSYKQRNWTNTVRDMQSFIDRYRSVAGSGDLLVQAQWRIVEARRAQNNARALTQSVLRIGDGLKLTVVAEGVETAQESDFLTGCGCPVLQGYLYARPMPADALQQWLLHPTEARP